MEAQHVRYDVDGGVASITLDRPERANAQNERMLDELDACFDTAVADDQVRVVVLRATGKHFSAGHDLNPGEGGPRLQRSDGAWWLEDIYGWEARKYVGYSLKWRNIPKPTIAAVQGRCIAGALNLIWPMDLIVAADDALFSDPVVAMGIGGVEYHGHTWELGARRAKEMLFTGRTIDAAEAERIGMVNRVVRRDDLWDEASRLAGEIARYHPFALRQAKRAVNQTLDIMGFQAAIQAVFDVHSTGHGNAISVAGAPVLIGLDDMKGHIRDGGR
jgi:enoyl-CoA hydratase/carnithine racemase